MISKIDINSKNRQKLNSKSIKQDPEMIKKKKKKEDKSFYFCMKIQFLLEF